jgi:L-lactate dehydrogenase (cytochrome)
MNLQEDIWTVPAPRRLSDVGCLQDYEGLARKRLPGSIFAFVRGGVESGAAYRANRESFGDWYVSPRTLTGVTTVDLSTDMFGQRYAAPFGIAPMGSVGFGRYRGDMEMALGAEQEGVPLILSGASSIPLEEVRAHAPGAWFQAYMVSDRADALALARRVGAAGFRVLVLTVDVPVLSNRFHYERSGFSLPLRLTARLVLDGLIHPRWLLGTALRTLLRDGAPHYENRGATRGGPMFGTNPAAVARKTVVWDDLAAIRDAFPGQVVLKGILSADDARKAASLGVDGIIISNHGGRQLDCAPPPLRVLPDIVAAVPHMPVMIDGGVRWGGDILKAIALGARFAFIGRPFYYANALGGSAAVRRAARIVKDEMTRDMIMLGVERPDDLGGDRLLSRHARSPQ